MTRYASGRALAACLGLVLGACGDPCVTPGAVCLIAGSGILGFNADGLPADETDFYLPSRVREDHDGRVLVMDFNNQRLRRVEADARVSTIAGDGFHAIARVGAPATDSSLENPVDFDFLPDGRLVFVSLHDPRVLVLEDDGTIGVLAGSGLEAMKGDEGDGGPAGEARFFQLNAIVVAGDGAIYVADQIAGRVRVIRGGTVDSVAGTGDRAFSGDGGPARDAALYWPSALAVDPAGRLYIADTFNHRVRRVGLDGVIETVAGSGEKAYGGDGGPATAARLDAPYGLEVDAAGTLYIADRNNCRVRRVRPDGLIDTLAGTGTRGYAGDGGDARDADFGNLAGLTLAGRRLLVADQSNSRARAITLPD